MRETQCGTICEYENGGSIRKAIDAAYEEFKKTAAAGSRSTEIKLPAKSISPAAQQYARPVLAGQFAELLNELKK